MSAQPPKPNDCTFVIFGITGDLAHRLVIPALYNLAEADLLPARFCIAGVARGKQDVNKVRSGLREALEKFGKRDVNPEIAEKLLACLQICEADPRSRETFRGLASQLDAFDGGENANRLYYFATPPDAFGPIATALGDHGLLKQRGKTWRRMVVEKPFGTDLDSARELNNTLLAVADEDQIYRIDHYLGKETVQNILVLRFANGMFEPVWNRNHIDHVQITVDETIGVGHRGSFYEQTGALRDMVPNHLFQLLSLVAMEPPAHLTAHAVRSEKAEVLSAIVTETEANALKNSVRGQYGAGQVGGHDIDDYRATKDVSPDSTTETFAALKLTIDNWRWAGVPFYLRTGKALGAKRTEVAIKFKEAPFAMFKDTPIERLSQNYLIIGIEPVETISLQFNTKVPGPNMATDGVEMRFCYKDYFKVAPAIGYETLLYDCMTGDNMLFQRADSVEAGWAAVMPFLNAWKKAGGIGLDRYEPGSNGPASADELLNRDGRRWRQQT